MQAEDAMYNLERRNSPEDIRLHAFSGATRSILWRLSASRREKGARRSHMMTHMVRWRFYLGSPFLDDV